MRGYLVLGLTICEGNHSTAVLNGGHSSKSFAGFWEGLDSLYVCR